MTVARDARVLKGAAARSARAVEPTAPPAEPGPRRVPRAVVDAALTAKRLVDDARAEAAAIGARARLDAARLAETASEDARHAEVARLSAQFLALRAEDERRADRDLERSVALARVLAERLLGEALEADPTRVVALARQALLEARGAKRVLIEACPLDAETLRSHVEGIGLPSDTLEIRSDPTLPRGSLRLHTNLGSLDAQLTPQLERLAEALRDALG